MKIENKNKIVGTTIFVVVASVAFGCSGTSTKPIEPTPSNQVKAQNSLPAEVPSTKVPADLINAGEFAENIYDFVKAKNWTKAAEKLDELKTVNAKLASENESSSELETRIAALEKSITAKDEIAALREANQLTLIVADLTARYNPVVPIEVVKLDFYGREIEIWSLAKDEARLKTTVQAIRETWNTVKSKVEAKGGTKQAKAFESLVADAETAKTSTEYAKLAKMILDEVDNLEKVFQN